jgi:predicted ribosomally synthesized peptide with nif11-like leader
MADSTRVTELIKTIAADPALRERLSNANADERAAALDELGFGDVTPADVAANAGQFLPSATEVVDEAELEAVAGGGGDTITTTTTTTTVTAAASAAAAT